MSNKLKGWSFTGLLTLVITIAACLEIYIDYRRTEALQLVTVTDITKIAERQIIDTTTTALNLLDVVAQTISEQNDAAAWAEEKHWTRLVAYCKSIPGCHSIGVIGAEGDFVANSSMMDHSGVNVADRAYFKMAVATKRFFIAPAVISRFKGNPALFSIAKPVYGRFGELLAVLVVGMNTDHLGSLYKSMGFSVNPAITVYKRNGDVVTRHPDMQRHLGKNNASGPLFSHYLRQGPSGVYRAVSTLDGVERLAAYQVLEDLDLVIYAGIEIDVAFARWKERSITTLAVVGCLLLTIWALMYYGLRSLTKQAVLASENKKLSILSNTDALTGIANRRSFDLALGLHWNRHQRSGDAFSVMLLDIDFFKKYNDKYGHQAGDACLEKVAHALRACVQRDGDLVARYGGEEFAIIAGCDAEGAGAIAQRIKLAVAALAIEHSDSDASRVVTISTGIADAAGGTASSAAGLLALADQALYEAKAKGRNQAVIHAAAPAHHDA